MLLKVLFREYDYPYNTISTTAGSADITANLNPAGGFNFNVVPIGTRIEIEISQGVSKFIGNVQSITDSSHLTLDREVEQTYENKVYWIDWTLFYLRAGELSRRVEGDILITAGTICLDSVDIDFFFDESIQVAGQTYYNPVYSAFQGSIDDKKRFLIRLQALTWDFYEEEQKLITNTGDYLIDHIENYLVANYKDLQSKTLFEGLIDFTTVEYPEVRYDGVEELIPEITFSVLDKLSALAIIDSSSTQKPVVHNAILRIPNLQNPVGFIFEPHTHAELGEICVLLSYEIVDYEGQAYPAISGPVIIHEYPVLEKGEILVDPRIGNGSKYIVIDSGLINYNPGNGARQTTWIKTATIMPPEVNVWINYVPSCLYYPKTYYDLDSITLETVVDGRSVISSFNAIPIIEAVIKRCWPDISSDNGNFINKMYSAEGALITEYPMPINYFEDLIDELPFGKEPFDAIKYLTNGMLCYLYFDNFGNLVLQKRNGFPEGGDKVIPVDYYGVIKKKAFWDRLVDSVIVKVESWIKDNNGIEITGESLLEKKENTKHRNELTVEIFLDKSNLYEFGISIDSSGLLVDSEQPGETDQQKILDRYAYKMAEKFFSFYGVRHEALDINLVKLDWDLVQWDLLNTFTYNNKRYFTTNFSIDLTQSAMNLQLISIEGYVYNLDTVFIPQILWKDT